MVYMYISKLFRSQVRKYVLIVDDAGQHIAFFRKEGEIGGEGGVLLQKFHIHVCAG